MSLRIGYRNHPKSVRIACRIHEITLCVVRCVDGGRQPLAPDTAGHQPLPTPDCWRG